MAMSTRRLLRANNGAGITSGDETDTFEAEPRSLGGGYRRPQPQSTVVSQVVSGALTSDDSEYSELAHFLFMGKKKDGWFAARFRRSADDGDDNGDGDGDTQQMKRLGKHNSHAYALALEPIEVRSEKIIMLAEAYAM